VLVAWSMIRPPLRHVGTSRRVQHTSSGDRPAGFDRPTCSRRGPGSRRARGIYAGSLKADHYGVAWARPRAASTATGPAPMPSRSHLAQVIAQPVERVQAVKSDHISPLGFYKPPLRPIRWSSPVVYGRPAGPSCHRLVHHPPGLKRAGASYVDQMSFPALREQPAGQVGVVLARPLSKIRSSWIGERGSG
jgi:hypothetical protein